MRALVAKSSSPHVSPALRHLRFNVMICSLTLAVALLLHMLLFAFVHFTDMRSTQLNPEQAKQHSTEVVLTPEGDAASNLEVTEASAANVNRVRSQRDLQFGAISGLDQTVGVIASFVLAVLILNSIVVGAGAGVPGIEKAVSAGTWSLVLLFMTLPLQSVLPAISFMGVFAGYEWLTSTSDAIRAGAPGAPSSFMLYLNGLLLPLLGLVVVVMISYRFSNAVEQGVIVTAVSELDEKLEKEISKIRVAAQSTPRSVGALNRAIGDESLEVAPSLTRPAAEPDTGGTMRPKPGDPLSRPI